MKSTSKQTQQSLSRGLWPAVLIAGSILAAHGGGGADQSYHLRAVSHIGAPAPGGGLFANDFEPTRLNNRGQVAFTAEPDPIGGEAVFLATSDGIQQMMRYGQPAPGTGLSFATFELGSLGLNEAGEVALAFTLGSPPDFAPDFGPPTIGAVYRWSPETQALSPVVVPNVTPVPGGGLFRGVYFNASLNNRGDLAFTGFVDTHTGPNYGTFVQDRSGTIRSIVRPGDRMPSGATFIFAGNPAVINDRGDVIFEGHTTADPAADINDVFVKRHGASSAELIPRPAGVVQEANLFINNDGEVAFGGSVAAFPAQIGIGSVYYWRGGNTTVVATTGGAAPQGGHFNNIPGASIGEQLSFNNRGEIAFSAATDTGDEAIYLYSSDRHTLRRVAGTGTTVIPGWTILSLEQTGVQVYPPPPGTFSGIPTCGVALNDWGQIAFAASVTDGQIVRGMLLLATPNDADAGHKQ